MEKTTETMSSKIKKAGHFIFEWTKKQIINYKALYGILGLAAIVLVLAKVLLFYFFMNITTNLFFVWITTCILLGVLFSSFRNKWIPLVIFTAITLIMFADVTYSSFFNRYLSIGMMGASRI